MINNTTATMNEPMDSLEKNHLDDFDKMKNFLDDKILQIMQENKKLIDAFNDLPFSMYWKDKKGLFVDCNQEMLDIFSLSSKSEIVGKPDLAILSGRDLEEIQTTDEFVMRTGRSVTLEEIIFVPSCDGLQTYKTYKRPVFDADKNVDGIFGISINITKQKAQELKITHLENILSGTTTHDIKNQTMIIGLVAEKEKSQLEQGLLKGEISQKLCDALQDNKDKILEQTQKIQVNINKNNEFFQKQILAENPQDQEEDFDEYPISRAIKDAVKQFQERALDHLIHVKCEEFYYNGVDTFVENIVSNLISNAVREIEKKQKGSIFISTSTTDEFNVLKVKDTAGGLTQQDIDKIFDLYKTGQVQGTGFGLSSAKIYMKKMQGKISAYLVDGDCIEFALIFPKVVM